MILGSICNSPPPLLLGASYSEQYCTVLYSIHGRMTKFFRTASQPRTVYRIHITVPGKRIAKRPKFPYATRTPEIFNPGHPCQYRPLRVDPSKQIEVGSR